MTHTGVFWGTTHTGFWWLSHFEFGSKHKKSFIAFIFVGLTTFFMLKSVSGARVFLCVSVLIGREGSPEP